MWWKILLKIVFVKIEKMEYWAVIKLLNCLWGFGQLNLNVVVSVWLPKVYQMVLTDWRKYILTKDLDMKKLTALDAVFTHSGPNMHSNEHFQCPVEVV